MSSLPPALRKWLSFGTGVGIEVGPQDLTVSVVRARPSGAELLDSRTIAGFRERPAVEWGREYADFGLDEFLEIKGTVGYAPAG